MGDSSVAVGEHVRPTGTDRDSSVPDGIYRVVGTTENSVTPLLVGDSTGRRIHTGDVVTVHCADLDTFESAENPDQSRSLGALIMSQLDGLRWSLWLLGRSVLSRLVRCGRHRSSPRRRVRRGTGPTA
ncbi:MAG: hypothetical protein ABEH86_13030 [Haloarcula sp.]